MGFKKIREAAGKAYIEERIPSELIGEIDNLALTLDFIYDFINKGDYESDQDLYEYIADILDGIELIESEPVINAVEKVIDLTDKHNKSDITIYELIEGFNEEFSTNIKRVLDGEENREDYVVRSIKLNKSIDRFYNELSDIFGIPREQLIENILTASMSDILSASSKGIKDLLPIHKSESEKIETIELKREDIDRLKEKCK